MTLDRMAAGGMYDQVGGGFHRYSTDERWHVPHFEKMLYDNALLVRLYVHAWQVTGNERYRRVATQTCEYLLRELRHAEGGVLLLPGRRQRGRRGQVLRLVVGRARGDRAARRSRPRSAPRRTATGRARTCCGARCRSRRWPRSWSSIPRSSAGELETARAELFEIREGRIHPATDDKVLAAWNGLAIAALAEAGRAFGEVEYVDAAVRAADFVLDAPAGRLGAAPAIVAERTGAADPRSPTTTRRWRTRAWSCTRRPSSSDGSSRRERWRTSSCVCSTTRGAAASSRRDGTRRRSSSVRRTSRTTPSPSGNSAAAERPAAPRPPDGRGRLRAGGRGRAAAGPGRDGGGAVRVRARARGARRVPVRRQGGGDRRRPRGRRRPWPSSPRSPRTASSPTTSSPCPPPATRPRAPRSRSFGTARRRDGRATAYVCERFECLLPVTDPAALAAQVGGTADRRVGSPERDRPPGAPVPRGPRPRPAHDPLDGADLPGPPRAPGPSVPSRLRDASAACSGCGRASATTTRCAIG